MIDLARTLRLRRADGATDQRAARADPRTRAWLEVADLPSACPGIGLTSGASLRWIEPPPRMPMDEVERA